MLNLRETSLDTRQVPGPGRRKFLCRCNVKTQFLLPSPRGEYSYSEADGKIQKIPANFRERDPCSNSPGFYSHGVFTAGGGYLRVSEQRIAMFLVPTVAARVGNRF